MKPQCSALWVGFQSLDLEYLMLMHECQVRWADTERTSSKTHRRVRFRVTNLTRVFFSGCILFFKSSSSLRSPCRCCPADDVWCEWCSLSTRWRHPLTCCHQVSPTRSLESWTEDFLYLYYVFFSLFFFTPVGETTCFTLDWSFSKNRRHIEKDLTWHWIKLLFSRMKCFSTTMQTHLHPCTCHQTQFMSNFKVYSV